MQIIDSSPEMTKLKAEPKLNIRIPFNDLEIGKSVAIPITDINEQVLRTYVSQASKRLKKKFRCVKHKELGLFEVGRVAEVVTDVAEALPTWDSSESMKGEENV